MRLKKLFPLMFGLLMILVSTVQLWANCTTGSSECYFVVENTQCQFSTIYDCPYCANVKPGNDWGRCCHWESGTCVLPESPWAAQGWLRYCEDYCYW